MKKYFFTLLILLFAACSTDSTITDYGLFEEQIQNIVKTKMDEFPVPGLQVAVSNPFWKKTVQISLGVANLDTDEPMTNGTLIKVGSITKSFTALGILTLVDKGLLDLDDPLNKYISISNPDFSFIPVRNLLNMNSGLRGYINDDDNDLIINELIDNPDRYFPPMELVDRAFTLTYELGFTTEYTFHYTNTNYILLGMIIENISGLAYNDFIKQEITGPLFLMNTFVPDENHYGPNFSRGYFIDSLGNATDYSDLNLSYVWSAGAVISTASDLCKWMNEVATGSVVSFSTSNLIYQGQQAEGEAYYTTGLISEPEKLWHNGTVLGYHGEMCYLKNSQVSIAVLSNCNLEGTDRDPVKEIIEEITDLINATYSPD